MSGVRSGSGGTGLAAGSQGTGVSGAPTAPPAGLDWAQVFTDAAGSNGAQNILDTHVGLYVSHYNQRAFISTDDGVTFTDTAMVGLNGPGYFTAYNPDTQRFARAGNQNLFYSDDGVNWTVQNSPINVGFISGTYAPWLGKFMSVRLSSSSQHVYTSANGVDWAFAGDASPASGLMYKIFNGPDHSIIVHSDTSWHSRMAAENSFSQITGLSGAGTDPEMVWTPSGWRAVGAASAVYGSADGNAFAAIPGALLPTYTTRWMGIAHDPVNDILAAWRDGEIFYSEDDGQTWTAATGDVPSVGLASIPGYWTEYVPSAGRMVIASDHDILVSPS
jgi:hypothetical protein